MSLSNCPCKKDISLVSKNREAGMIKQQDVSPGRAMGEKSRRADVGVTKGEF